MKKRECCCERETIVLKEEEFNEDSIHTIVFTAGTSILLMLCLKRFLVEQWHAWVFLFLNVILLAILFMSTRPCYWGSTSSESESNVEEEVKKDIEVEEGKECYKKQCWTSTSSTHHVHVVKNETEEELEEEEEEEEENVPMLSKEELNERVEAFIAMFRQHLISDVKQAENFRVQKIEVPCC